MCSHRCAVLRGINSKFPKIFYIRYLPYCKKLKILLPQKRHDNARLRYPFESLRTKIKACSSHFPMDSTHHSFFFVTPANSGLALLPPRKPFWQQHENDISHHETVTNECVGQPSISQAFCMGNEWWIGDDYHIRHCGGCRTLAKYILPRKAQKITIQPPVFGAQSVPRCSGTRQGTCTR